MIQQANRPFLTLSIFSLCLKPDPYSHHDAYATASRHPAPYAMTESYIQPGDAYVFVVDSLKIHYNFCYVLIATEIIDKVFWEVFQIQDILARPRLFMELLSRRAVDHSKEPSLWFMA